MNSDYYYENNNDVAAADDTWLHLAYAYCNCQGRHGENIDIEQRFSKSVYCMDKAIETKPDYATVLKEKEAEMKLDSGKLLGSIVNDW